MAISLSNPWLLGPALLVGVAVVAMLMARRFARRAAAAAASAHERERMDLPLKCPRCGRAFPVGLRFCPADAARLVVAAEGASSGGATGVISGGRCPRCARTFEAGVRYCPMDAEELVALRRGALDEETDARDARDGLDDDAGEAADHLLAGDGKICPECGTRYDAEACYCGRDAAELVSLN
jgi:uncharacterized protein YbaR (Trm112 family)